ncbi:MAG: cytidine deaminase [Verrucomicrobiota bacterium]|jgi:cytidine deaminase
MEIDKLIRIASDVREKAYAPYSKFQVGAALRTPSGQIYAGANIENISLGLTICAERVCVGSAVAAGEKDFEMIAIVADSEIPVVPCGACRQVLAEFSPSLKIVSTTLSGVAAEFRLDELLPKPKQGIL